MRHSLTGRHRLLLPGTVGGTAFSAGPVSFGLPRWGHSCCPHPGVPREVEPGGYSHGVHRWDRFPTLPSPSQGSAASSWASARSHLEGGPRSNSRTVLPRWVSQPRPLRGQRRRQRESSHQAEGDKDTSKRLRHQALPRVSGASRGRNGPAAREHIPSRPSAPNL